MKHFSIVILLMTSSILFFASGVIKQPQLNNTTYDISCKGQCGSRTDNVCGLTGNTDAVQCACSNCSMLVVVNGEKKGQIPAEFVAIKTEIDALKEFIKKTYNTDQYTILSVTQEQDATSTATTFFFELATGEKGSVMYVKRNNGPTIQIDCAASECDCREKWVFGPTPHAECTCQADCKMTLTEIK